MGVFAKNVHLKAELVRVERDRDRLALAANRMELERDQMRRELDALREERVREQELAAGGHTSWFARVCSCQRRG